MDEIANYERDPQLYIQEHELIPKWTDDYTMDNFYETRAFGVVSCLHLL